MAERIVERLIRERDTRYGDGIYTTTQIQFAWNSNHMEGSTLTAKQTAQLFATGTYTTDGSEQVNPDDALETRNHFAAFRWILDHADEPVDRDMVCHLHAILKQGTRQVSDSLFNVGGYKTRPNFIGNPVTPTRTALPQDVPEFMDRLFDMCTKLEDEPYQIARVHWTFEKIHPFSDGNGRIGRLIMFKELLRIDALPVLVHDAYRAEYVNGISKFPDEPGWLVDTLLFERDLYRSHVLKRMPRHCVTRTMTNGIWLSIGWNEMRIWNSPSSSTRRPSRCSMRSISSANGSYGANSGPTVLLWWFLLPNVT